jgi:sugar phosphate isomerase/epimerase
VGNLTMGGGDPLQYLRRFRDRYWSFHIKDVVPDRSRDTALGAGRVDLKAILEAIPEIDRKPCIVEQEGAANDTLAARADFGYLSRLSFQPYEG